MSTEAIEHDASTETESMWEVRIGNAAGQFFSSRRKAAAGLVRLAERRMNQGRPLTFTVLRLNDNDRPDWDGSDDVAQVFAAIGWPASGCEAQREETIDVLEAILSA